MSGVSAEVADINVASTIVFIVPGKLYSVHLWVSNKVLQSSYATHCCLSYMLRWFKSHLDTAVTLLGTQCKDSSLLSCEIFL